MQRAIEASQRDVEQALVSFSVLAEPQAESSGLN